MQCSSKKIEATTMMYCLYFLLHCFVHCCTNISFILCIQYPFLSLQSVTAWPSWTTATIITVSVCLVATILSEPRLRSSLTHGFHIHDRLLILSPVMSSFVSRRCLLLIDWVRRRTVTTSSLIRSLLLHCHMLRCHQHRDDRVKQRLKPDTFFRTVRNVITILKHIIIIVTFRV